MNREGFRITSLQNPRVKRAARLRERRARDRCQEFIIEGYRELLRALDAGWPVGELFVCAEMFQGSNEPALIARFRDRGTAIMETSDSVFRKLAYRDRPEGLLGVAQQRHCDLSELALSGLPLLVVAEGLEKPGNLGTILRSADAAAVDGLVLCDKCTDLFNPNVVRASTGMLFRVPVAEATSAEAIEWLRSRNIRILAATPHAEECYTNVDLTVPLAVAVGAEQYGLSKTWMAEADCQVRIPMLGVADSLNVASATTLLLYEAVRQRTAQPPP